ncbi:MAG: MFS transporter [Ktedonobacterales bacterium]
MAKVRQASDDGISSGGKPGAEQLAAEPIPSASVSYKRPRSSIPLEDQRLPPHAIAASSRGFRTVLRNPLFLRLWISQLLSQTIMNASNYGLIVLVATQSSHSNFATSLSIVAFALPAAVFAPIAGVLVDRFNRRSVLWVSNLLRAVAAVAFAAALYLKEAGIIPSAVVPALLLSLLTATIGQFFAPAEGASIPLLVHRDELVNALSLFNITFTISQALGILLLGPAIFLFTPTSITIGGLTLAHANPATESLFKTEILFIIVAVLYVACIGLILSIPKARLQGDVGTGRHRRLLPESNQLRSIWMGIREAGSFVRHDQRLLIAILQLCMGGIIVAIVSAIAPNFVLTFFDEQPDHMVLVLFPAGVGLVLGSAFTPTLIRRLQYVRTIMIGMIALSLSIALLTLLRAVALLVSPPASVLDGSWVTWWYLGLAIFLTFCIGLALNFISVPTQTTMQARSPDRIKGRVLALQSMIQNGLNVLVLPLIGITADVLGIPVALDILAVTILITGLATIYFDLHAGPDKPTARPLAPKPIMADGPSSSLRRGRRA